MKDYEIWYEICFCSFKKWLDWFIKFRDPREIWKAQPTYLMSECTYVMIAILTFIHCMNISLYPASFDAKWSTFLVSARRVGGRYRFLWLAIWFHGTFVECVSYWTPDIDNFWHSQTTTVLLGRRLPLHIMLVCKVSDSWTLSVILCDSVWFFRDCFPSTFQQHLKLIWLEIIDCRSGLHLQRVCCHRSSQVIKLGWTLCRCFNQFINRIEEIDKLNLRLRMKMKRFGKSIVKWNGQSVTICHSK